MIRSEGFADIARTLRHPHFGLFQLGRTCFLTTAWMYRLAMAWMVWQMTESTTWLGIIGFFDLAPSIVISPLAGTLADRMDRLKILRWTQALHLVHAVALTVLVHFDMLTIWILAGFALYSGIVSAAQQPTVHAVVPSLVPKKDLTTAFGLNSLLFNLSRFVGPMIAGFVISLWGTAPAILCNTVGVAVFSGCLILMHAEYSEAHRKPGHDQTHGSLLGGLKEGILYAARHPGIGPMLFIMILVSVLTFPIVQLLPGFADGVFKAGANGLAWMLAALGVGAILQGMYLAQRGPITGLTTLVCHNVLLSGIAFVALTITGDYWIGLTATFLIGITNGASRIGALTLLQNATEPHMRGRISSFYGTLYHAGPAFGSLVMGALGDIFGIRTTIFAVGILTCGVWIWALYLRGRMAPALEVIAADAPPEGQAAATPRAAQ